MAEPADKQRVETALAQTSCYSDAVDVLKKHYDNNRFLFRCHYERPHQQDTVKKSVEDLSKLEERILTSIRGMKASNGFTTEQMVVAHLENTLSQSLLKQWRQHIP